MQHRLLPGGGYFLQPEQQTPPKQLCAAPGRVHVFTRRSLRCTRLHTGKPGCLLKQNLLD